MRRNNYHIHKEIIYPVSGMAVGAVIGGAMAGLPGIAVGGLSGFAIGIMNATDEDK